jgi:hypothetical protein
MVANQIRADRDVFFKVNSRLCNSRKKSELDTGHIKVLDNLPGKKLLKSKA